MKKVLVLNSSFTGKSLAAAKAIEASRSNETWTYVDLNKKLEGQLLTNTTAEQFYADAASYIEELKNFDEIILLSGMINFNLSPVLESWFAKVTVPGVTFAYNAQGKYAPLEDIFKHKKVQVIITSGSAMSMYPEVAKHIDVLAGEKMKFIGFHDVHTHWLDSVNMPQNANKSAEEFVAENKSKLGL